MDRGASRATWRKSSRSSPNHDNCVETAATGCQVAVRDSKNPDGGRLHVSAHRWASFTRTVKDGKF